MVVWRYALLPLVCLLLALTHSLVGLANLVLVVWRVGDGLGAGLTAIAQSTMGKFVFCTPSSPAREIMEVRSLDLVLLILYNTPHL